MRPIIVAFGEHAHADAALRWGGELASITGAPLRVVSVYEPTYAEFSPARYDEITSRRHDLIKGVLGEIGHPEAKIDIRKHDQPFDAIANDLAAHDASVGVIGATDSHRPGGFGSGQPARQLLHQAHTPIASIPPGYESLRNGTVVVGVDGSGANAAALAFAEEIAAPAGGRLHAVFAYDPIDETFVRPQPANGEWHSHSNDVRAELAKVTKAPVELHMTAGHPSEVLIEHAQRERAAAIVVGTRGRGGFNGLVLGRVPTQLIAHATCPLIVVPS